MGTLALVFVTVCLLEMTGYAAGGTPAGSPPQEQRQGFQRKVQSELDDLASKIRSLEAKSERAGSKTRQELRKDLRKLKADLETARKKLAKLQDSSAGAWETLKEDSDAAARKVRESYEKLAARLKR